MRYKCVRPRAVSVVFGGVFFKSADTIQIWIEGQHLLVSFLRLGLGSGSYRENWAPFRRRVIRAIDGGAGAQKFFEIARETDIVWVTQRITKEEHRPQWVLELTPFDGSNDTGA